MSVHVSASFAFEFERRTAALLQFEAAYLPEQTIDRVSTRITPTDHFARVAAQDDIGQRIWIQAEGRVEVDYEVTVTSNRLVHDLGTLAALEPHALAGEAVPYLLDSRYCRADKFQSLVESEFGGTAGGERVVAIRNWIADHFSYVPGVSDARTDATESFIKRQGICRDYTHVLVTLARASTIPARYVACFAPGVTPQDFHAVAEVFLADPDGGEGAGTWQLVDATGMADLTDAVKIGVGRDAADVSFLTTFGAMTFLRSEVAVSKDGKSR
ncbi:MAG: transglutaminase family protein [Erythrobacter sp.]